MRGFTLVELMIVIAIMAGLAGVLIPQFSRFSKDQVLMNAAQDFQTKLRSVQNNALSGVKCPTDVAASEWFVEFTSNSAYDIKSTCFDNPTPLLSSHESLPAGIVFSSIDAGVCQSYNAQGSKISFKNISGTVSFQGPSDGGCAGEIKNLRIMVQSLLGSGSATEVIAEKGGSIYRSSEETTPVPPENLGATPNPTPTSIPGPTATPTSAPTSTPVPPTPTTGPTGYSVYADSLTGGWTNTSWSAATIFDNTSPAYSGARSILYTAGGYGALSLQYNSMFNTAPYTRLKFYIYPTASGQTFNLQVDNDSSYAVVNNLTANQWNLVDKALNTFGASNIQIWRVVLKNPNSGAQPTVYIDSVEFY